MLLGKKTLRGILMVGGVVLSVAMLTIDVAAAPKQVSILKREENESPIIIGADDVTVTVGGHFDKIAGVIAIDKEDGDLTAEIIVQGDVDINTVGTYVLIYIVTNSKGVTTTKERIVIVA